MSPVGSYRLSLLVPSSCSLLLEEEEEEEAYFLSSDVLSQSGAELATCLPAD